VLGRTTVPYYKKAFNIKSVAIIFDAKDATAATVGSKIMPGLMKDNEIEVLNRHRPAVVQHRRSSTSARRSPR